MLVGSVVIAAWNLLFLVPQWLFARSVYYSEKRLREPKQKEESPKNSSNSDSNENNNDSSDSSEAVPTSCGAKLKYFAKHATFWPVIGYASI